METLEGMFRFVTDCCAAAVEAYTRGVDPTGDMVRRKDAERFLAAQGFKPAVLKAWTGAGLLHAMRQGAGKNSPICYSMAELRAAVATMRLREMRR